MKWLDTGCSSVNQKLNLTLTLAIHASVHTGFKIQGYRLRITGYNDTVIVIENTGIQIEEYRTQGYRDTGFRNSKYRMPWKKHWDLEVSVG